MLVGRGGAGGAPGRAGAFAKRTLTPRGPPVPAEAAAAEQATPGDSEAIAYQDTKGEWHEEIAKGEDRPSADVTDM